MVILAIWMVLSVLALLPLLVTRFPPLTDYVQWVFQGYLFERLINGGAGDAVQQYYHVSLVPVPNAVAPVAIGLLQLWLVPADAGRVFLAVSVLVFSYGFGFLVRTLQRRPTVLELLGFPWAYGYFLYWGFVSYVLALGLALLGVGLLHHLRVQPAHRRAGVGYAGLALFSMVVYLCHLFGWAVLTLTALLYALQSLTAGKRREAGAIVLMLLPSFLLLIAYAMAGGGNGTTELYPSLIDKGLAIASPLFLFLRTDPFPAPFPVMPLNALCGLLLMAVLVGHWQRRAVGETQRPVLASAGALLLGAVLVPFNWFGGLVAPDNRLILPAVLLGVAALPGKPWRLSSGLCTAAVVVLILGLHTVQFARTGARLAAVQTATAAAIPPAGSVLLLTIHDPPVRAACQTGRLPSLGAPVLDWFGLYRLMAIGGTRSSIFDSSIIVPTARSSAAPELTITQVRPSGVQAVLGSRANLVARFGTIEAFGCQEALQTVQSVLTPAYHVRARGDGYEVLVR